MHDLGWRGRLPASTAHPAARMTLKISTAGGRQTAEERIVTVGLVALLSALCVRGRSEGGRALQRQQVRCHASIDDRAQQGIDDTARATEACVKAGAKYVLEAGGTVYVIENSETTRRSPRIAGQNSRGDRRRSTATLLPRRRIAAATRGASSGRGKPETGCPIVEE